MKWKENQLSFKYSVGLNRARGLLYGIEYARSATSNALLYARVKAGIFEFRSVWNQWLELRWMAMLYSRSETASLNGYASSFAPAKQNGTGAAPAEVKLLNLELNDRGWNGTGIAPAEALYRIISVPGASPRQCSVCIDLRSNCMEWSMGAAQSSTQHQTRFVPVSRSEYKPLRSSMVER